jgi:hypothetical protein
LNYELQGEGTEENGRWQFGWKANANPILDTRTYEFEFPDGQTAELAATVIAQNMYAMCDVGGNQCLLLAGIVDHKKDNSAVE